MKTIKLMIVALPFLLFAVGCAGFVVPEFRESLDPDEQAISYIDQHGKTKNDAYVAAHTWIAKNFNSANDVIQMQDKEAGQIIVKAVYPFTWYVEGDLGTKYPYSSYVQYTLSLYVKDKKIKTEFMTGVIKSVGSMPSDGRFLPKNMMPDLLAYYQKIHTDIMQNIVSKKDDF